MVPIKDSHQQIDPQVDRPKATTGNVTANIKPPGTTLGVEN